MKSVMEKPPAFVISLDFELHWGMSDHVKLEDHPYARNIIGARDAIPRILEVFSVHNIRATWATVGFLFAESKGQITRLKPTRTPNYANSARNNWCLEIGDNENDDPLHYGRSLVDLIGATPGQELASHTFSHFYCHEPGQGPEDFLADLKASKEIALEAGYVLRSLVLPRNQIDDAYLDAIGQAGFACYRGNPSNAGFGKGRHRRTAYRVIRLLDSYVNLTGHHTFKWSDLSGHTPINIPASRFFRPYSGVAPLDILRMRRIKQGMLYAAKHSQIFHLWWHPHNFGVNTKENIEELELIIYYFTHLARSYGMRSMSMSDVARDAEVDVRIF